MSYWKSKVLPGLKKILSKGQKNNAVEACKKFDKSKEDIEKEFDEISEELQSKILAIYRPSSTDTKVLLKKPSVVGVIEYSEVVQNLLIELANAGCPGAQYLSDAATKHGPTAMSEPIVYLLSKTSAFVAAEEDPEVEETDLRSIREEAMSVKMEEPSKEEEMNSSESLEVEHL